MNIRKLVKILVPVALFRRIEPFGHLLEAILAQTLAGFPARKLKVIGVTGTDGKTTTATLIAAMMNHAGQKTALITTVSVDFADGKGTRPSPTGLTTAGVWQLVRMLKVVRSNKAEWLVLEVSSHALAQNRVWGIPFSVAVFTNLSHEHLDYHRTMENYRNAKLRLFKRCAANTSGLQAGIINTDDDNASYFEAVSKHATTYGLNSGDLRATSVKLTSAGSRFAVKTPDGELRIQSHLPGRFNVYNSLAAIGVGRIVGLPNNAIEAGIASLGAVSGRMQRIDAGQPFEVIIDYAVTPAALESALKTVKEVTSGRTIVVFGATGDRDKEKRPVMGQVAARNADLIFLTDDEPYTESAEKIRKAVLAGIEHAKGAAKTHEIGDREAAIKAALTAARSGDSVIITGIGHQKTRNIGGVKQPWDEVAITNHLITGLKSN